MPKYFLEIGLFQNPPPNKSGKFQILLFFNWTLPLPNMMRGSESRFLCWNITHCVTIDCRCTSISCFVVAVDSLIFNQTLNHNVNHLQNKAFTKTNKTVSGINEKLFVNNHNLYYLADLSFQFWITFSNIIELIIFLTCTIYLGSFIVIHHSQHLWLDHCQLVVQGRPWPRVLLVRAPVTNIKKKK